MRKTFERDCKRFLETYKEAKRPCKKEHFIRILEGLYRIKAKYHTWGLVAGSLGLSRGWVDCWISGQRLISVADATKLAFHDEGLPDTTLVHRLRYWFDATGIAATEEELQKIANESTDVASTITHALEDLYSKTKEHHLPRNLLHRALSCYLGHKRLEEDVKKWLRTSNGEGTTAVFWKFDEAELTQIFQSKQTREFLYRALEARLPSGSTSPDRGPDLRAEWEYPNGPSRLHVKIFLHGQVDTQKVKTTMAAHVRTLGLDVHQTKRLTVYYSKERFYHPIDCWMFLSADEFFASFVTTAKDVQGVVERNPGVLSGDWNWTSQIIQVTNEDGAIVTEWLTPHNVTYNKVSKIIVPENPPWAVVDLTQ